MTCTNNSVWGPHESLTPGGITGEGGWAVSGGLERHTENESIWLGRQVKFLENELFRLCM